MKKTFLYILALIVFSSCLQKTHEVEATSYLQQGYESEYSNKDAQALLYYKRAEQMAQTSNNRKLHFLIYTAIGKLNAKHAHYEIAMDYFRKAIDLKLSVPLWHTMTKDFPPRELTWYKGDTYQKVLIKQYAESLLRLIERMDFTSQETIELQEILRCKDEREWIKADSLIQEAIKHTTKFEHLCRLYAEQADTYSRLGEYSEADSLYAEALKSSSTSFKASVYKNIYLQLQASGQTDEAYKMLQQYTRELEMLYSSSARAELLEIEKQYDYASLLSENERFRQQWVIALLTTLSVICSLSILIWGIWKYHRRQKEELLYTYKKQSYSLQTQIEILQEQMEESEGETQSLQKQIHFLENEKREKDIRIHQLEVTFRAKKFTLSSETAEAVQLYLHLVSRKGSNYHPAEDRIKLAHWLNISKDQFAERLSLQYPSLSYGEKDICYLHAIGYSFDEMADLLKIQTRSVDRSVYRICRKMGLEQGNKDDFANQLKSLNIPH